MPLSRQNGEMGNYILITLIYISSISPTNFNLLFDARCFLLFFFSFPFFPKNIYETHLGDTANKTVT